MAKSTAAVKVDRHVQNRTKIAKKVMIEALIKSLGVVTIACKACGILRGQHYTWLDNDPNYKADVESIADIVLDFAENMLHKQIQNSDTIATIFYLKTKGKRRGYIERSEIDLTTQGQPVTAFTFTVVKPGDQKEIEG